MVSPTKLNFGTVCVVQFGSLWFIVVQTSVEPNKFLVRFFVSYCLHIYRLVSVIHRINAAFGVSSKFVPYRPNWDLVVNKLGKKLNAITELGNNIDMNNIIENCRGTASVTTNAPVTGYCFVEVMTVGYDTMQRLQKLSSPSTYYIRHRRYQSTSPYYSWTSWFKFEGTEVT